MIAVMDSTHAKREMVTAVAAVSSALVTFIISVLRRL